MATGGGQGDSGGVGAYTGLWRIRHAFLTGAVRQGANPRDLSSSGPSSSAFSLKPPASHHPLLEMGFSDNGRLIASNDVELGHLIDAARHGCRAAGGSVDENKLATFKLGLDNGFIKYRTGSLSTIVGGLHHKTQGLSLVGIPLVMHEPPRTNINATLARLKLVLAGVLRLRPTYILALCA